MNVNAARDPFESNIKKKLLQNTVTLQMSEL